MADTGKTILNDIYEAAVLSGLTAGYGFISKKIVKETVTNDPSANIMNAVKFIIPVSLAVWTKRYLEDVGILPKKI